MNDEAIINNFQRIIAECELIEIQSLQAIRNILQSNIPDEEKTLWKLELNHRIQGTPRPTGIIIEKFRSEYPHLEFVIENNIRIRKKK